jgi:hypothetical protein
MIRLSIDEWKRNKLWKDMRYSLARHYWHYRPGEVGYWLRSSDGIQNRWTSRNHSIRVVQCFAWRIVD